MIRAAITTSIIAGALALAGCADSSGEVREAQAAELPAVEAPQPLPGMACGGIDRPCTIEGVVVTVPGTGNAS